MAELLGARAAQPTGYSRFILWLHGHRDDALRSARELWRAPVSALMTLLVIGVALALPAALQVALKNGQHIAGGVASSTQITLYLQEKLSERDALQVRDRLRTNPAIAQVDYISAEQALIEFRQQSGFGEALDSLTENPLPPVLVITPVKAQSDPEQASFLLSQLRALPEVSLAQLDMEWLRKLQALMQLGQRAVMVLSVLFGLAVILIVGNTIRLAIQNRRAEIEVYKLVGATDAFIRRPFLYSGLWMGVCGAILAWLMVIIALWWLKAPVQDLASLYQTELQIDGMSSEDILRLIGFGILLGLGGSILSVNRHLREIEPR